VGKLRTDRGLPEYGELDGASVEMLRLYHDDLEAKTKKLGQ